MLFAFTTAEEAFPLLLIAADNVFCDPKRAKLEFDTGEEVAGLGIGFKMLGLDEMLDGLSLFNDEVGDFILDGSLTFVPSSVLEVIVDNLETVGLNGRVGVVGGLKDRYFETVGLEVEFVKNVVLFVCGGDVDFSGIFLKFLKSLSNDLLGFIVG